MAGAARRDAEPTANDEAPGRTSIRGVVADKTGDVRGRTHFFAFCGNTPDTPPPQQARGTRSVAEVTDAFTSIPGLPVTSDVLLDAREVSAGNIKARLARYAEQLGPQDTFLMYSHSHGTPRGLLLYSHAENRKEILPWHELADAILELPARNVVVFTMACHSGYLAAAINRAAERWKHRSQERRNLIVLTAVTREQTSDPEPSPTSAGMRNRFTYAVASAVRGADGYPALEQNGRLEMRELVEYVLATARRKNHDPQFAGTYVSSDVLLSEKSP